MVLGQGCMILAYRQPASFPLLQPHFLLQFDFCHFNSRDIPAIRVCYCQCRLREPQKKTDEQLAKTIKRLDEIGRQLGDLRLVQGEIAGMGALVVKDEIGIYAEKACFFRT